MATRKSTRGHRRSDAQLAFDAIAIEGGLLSPEWLARAAQLDAGGQGEADYRIPKGLNLRDEVGRYWRIARALWTEFEAGRGKTGSDEVHARALSNKFVVPLLRDCFGFGTIQPVPPAEAEGRAFPIGHSALEGRVPVVIGPAGIGLDTFSPLFGDGGRRRSAFGLCQEFLNAEDAALWGIVTDGTLLRVVRDNASLTRPAWLEADLSRIFTEERYADFTALWLLIHETRFGRPDQPVTECSLEAWREAGREEGTRAREQLRHGVEDALVALGQGFLAHPDNHVLRSSLTSGAVTKDAYFQELLRLAYRMIFLLTVEERGVLHAGDASEEACKLYAEGYSLRRLRDRSVKRGAHDRFHDGWDAVKIVLRGLAKGEPRLGLPALAGLFAEDQCPTLDGSRLENRFLLRAVFRLSWLREPSGLSRVNWRDMGPEELGSVYESLLELVPQIAEGGRAFSFATGAETKGHARKTSGSYYTPDSLVQVLLDSALEPVIERTVAEHPDNPVDALLSLSVVDPACGSGHFLLAAARRLAAHVARLQAGGTPSAPEYRRALRSVVGRCIYGVDLNPMAVELCKVSLWMEAVEPGLPLTFLRSHIRHGNALIGTTPDLMANGIPDDAWKPIEGDDKKVASALKKRNKQAPKGQRSLESLWSQPSKAGEEELRRAVSALEAASDATVEQLAAKQTSWEELLTSAVYQREKLVADAWCAAFVWPKHGGSLGDAAPTNDVWLQIRDGQGRTPGLTAKTVDELAKEYNFFHWHLAFPQVFASGGFDVVLGNPPWEELTPSAKEFFSIYDQSIRFQDKAGSAAVAARLLEDVSISEAWTEYRRSSYGQIHFLKSSGRYVLFAPGNLGKGDFNVYRMFVETAMYLVRRDGYCAQFVPDTMYCGATTMAIRRALFETFEWTLLVGIENAKEGWFKGVDSRAKFCLYSAKKGAQTQTVRAVFNVRSRTELVAELGSTEPIEISPETVAAFSPDALSIAEISSVADLKLAVRMQCAWPPFANEAKEQPLHRHMREVDMTNDSSLFQDLGPGLPVYEGRMVSQFDHRAKGYQSGRARSAVWTDYAFSDPAKSITPQFFVRPDDLPDKLGRRPFSYRVGFCNIASPTNERTLVAALIPAGAVCGNKVPTITFDAGFEWYAMLWLAVANSFAMDFIVRKKVSLTMTNTIVDSLPFPRLPDSDPRVRLLVPLAARLCCVGQEMQGYWDALASLGWVRPLDVSADGLVDEAAREVAVAELNAAVAIAIFGISRDDLGYILDTFPIVRKRDEKAHGEYRTKRVILEIYDEMAEATRSGKPYETRLDPPPADPRVAHPANTRPDWGKRNGS